MIWPWRLTLFCGLAPLLSGTLLFLAWGITRASWLMLAGLITIYSGLALFVIGLISLIVYTLNARAMRLENWVRRAAAGGAILVGNFPAAAAFVGAAIYIMSTYTVIVENGSNNTIERITLIDPARSRHEFGSVAAHERREEKFHFGGEGECVLRDIHQWRGSVWHSLRLHFRSHRRPCARNNWRRWRRECRRADGGNRDILNFRG